MNVTLPIPQSLLFYSNEPNGTHIGVQAELTANARLMKHQLSFISSYHTTSTVPPHSPVPAVRAVAAAAGSGGRSAAAPVIGSSIPYPLP